MQLGNNTMTWLEMIAFEVNLLRTILFIMDHCAVVPSKVQEVKCHFVFCKEVIIVCKLGVLKKV